MNNEVNEIEKNEVDEIEEKKDKEKLSFSINSEEEYEKILSDIQKLNLLPRYLKIKNVNIKREMRKSLARWLTRKRFF